ncbi:unnamed protein product [Pedinophyceae sp. YPF-701]|nr:unnamed protein product [Pedinophyceae sp. YPF-701]
MTAAASGGASPSAEVPWEEAERFVNAWVEQQDFTVTNVAAGLAPQDAIVVDVDTLLTLAVSASGWHECFSRAAAFGADDKDGLPRLRAFQPLAVVYEAERILWSLTEATVCKLHLVSCSAHDALYATVPLLQATRRALLAHLHAVVRSAASCAPEDPERVRIHAPISDGLGPAWRGLLNDVAAPLVVMDDLTFLEGSGSAEVARLHFLRAIQMMAAVAIDVKVARVSPRAIDIGTTTGIVAEQSIRAWQHRNKYAIERSEAEKREYVDVHAELHGGALAWAARVLEGAAGGVPADLQGAAADAMSRAQPPAAHSGRALAAVGLAAAAAMRRWSEGPLGDAGADAGALEAGGALLFRALAAPLGAAFAAVVADVALGGASKLLAASGGAKDFLAGCGDVLDGRVLHRLLVGSLELTDAESAAAAQLLKGAGLVAQLPQDLRGVRDAVVQLGRSVAPSTQIYPAAADMADADHQAGDAGRLQVDHLEPIDFARHRTIPLAKYIYEGSEAGKAHAVNGAAGATPAKAKATPSKQAKAPAPADEVPDSWDDDDDDDAGGANGAPAVVEPAELDSWEDLDGDDVQPAVPGVEADSWEDLDEDDVAPSKPAEKKPAPPSAAEVSHGGEFPRTFNKAAHSHKLRPLMDREIKSNNYRQNQQKQLEQIEAMARSLAPLEGRKLSALHHFHPEEPVKRWGEHPTMGQASKTNKHVVTARATAEVEEEVQKLEQKLRVQWQPARMLAELDSMPATTVPARVLRDGQWVALRGKVENGAVSDADILWRGLSIIQLAIDGCAGKSLEAVTRSTVSAELLKSGSCAEALAKIRSTLQAHGFGSVLQQLDAVLGDLAPRKLLAKEPQEVSRVVRAAMTAEEADADRLARLQMGELGYKLPRNLGNAPDPHGRVAFRPDPWQRDLLDVVDRRQSAIVVAPTSAGKSFICYYCIASMLRYHPKRAKKYEDPEAKRLAAQPDPPLCVYVVPTKALAMQVMADLVAQFGEARNEIVAGLWDRDMRINENACRCLVTVPEMLQLKLLNPVQGPAFAARLRYAILDEIHCMDKDRAAYQRVLQAMDCPILAISATIGNQQELVDWVRGLKGPGPGLSTVVRADGQPPVVQVPGSIEITSGAELRPEERAAVARSLGTSMQEVAAMKQLPEPFVRDRVPERWVQLDYLSYQSGGLLDEMHPLAAHRLPELSRLLKRAPAGAIARTLSPRSGLQLLDAMVKAGVDPGERASTVMGETAWGVPQTVVLTRPEARGLCERLLDRLREVDQDTLARVVSHLPGVLSEERSAEHDPIDPSSEDATTSDAYQYREMAGLIDALHKRDLLPALVFSYAQWKVDDFPRAIIASRRALLTPKQKKKVVELEAAAWEATRAFNAFLSKPQLYRQDNAETDYEERADPESERLAEAMTAAWQELVLLEGGGARVPDITGELTRTNLQKYLDRACDEESRYHQLHGYLMRGFGSHHGAHKYDYRVLVENLFRRKALRAVFCTSTLAYGINMPCRTAVVCGDSPYLTVLDFQQVSGRAGRRGIDDRGACVFFALGDRRVRQLMTSSLPPLRVGIAMTASVVLSSLALCDPSWNGAADGQPGHAQLERAAKLLTAPLQSTGRPTVRRECEEHFAYMCEYLLQRGLVDRAGHVDRSMVFLLYLWWQDPDNFLLHRLVAPLLSEDDAGSAGSLIRRLTEASEPAQQIRGIPKNDAALPKKKAERQQFEAERRGTPRGKINAEWRTLKAPWTALFQARYTPSANRLVEFLIDDRELFEHLRATGELIPGIGVCVQETKEGSATVMQGWLVLRGRAEQPAAVRSNLQRMMRCLACLANRVEVTERALKRLRGAGADSEAEQMKRRILLREQFREDDALEDLRQIDELFAGHNDDARNVALQCMLAASTELGPADVRLPLSQAAPTQQGDAGEGPGAAMHPFSRMTGHGAQFGSLSHVRRKLSHKLSLHEGSMPYVEPHGDRASAYVSTFFRIPSVKLLVEEAMVAQKDEDAWAMLDEFGKTLKATVSGMLQVLGNIGLSWIKDKAQHWKVRAVLMLAYTSAEFEVVKWAPNDSASLKPF